MRPDARGHAPAGRAAPSTHADPPPPNGQVVLSVTRRRLVVLNTTGCPCGCRSVLPWSDDADCIHHQPMPGPVSWIPYDIHDLGLEPHDPALCRSCQAVAS